MNGVDIASLRFLIVEDNQHFRALVRTILEALGASMVEEARDGVEALEVLERFPADLAIMDWRMDQLDGLECVRRIRANTGSPSRFLPILMVTGFADPELANKARDAGVDDFLSKPISAKSLLSRIVSVVGRPRPFVAADDYFGPDRRFADGEPRLAERRLTPPSIIERPQRGVSNS